MKTVRMMAMIFAVNCLFGCNYYYSSTKQPALCDVVNTVKTNHQAIEKRLVIAGTHEYYVKSVLDNYEVFYDLDNVVPVDDKKYRINFIVTDLADGLCVEDFLVWEPEENQTGVILSFDDFYASWDEYFYLFENYNVRATWFVFGYWTARKTFCQRAVSKGHEIGWHTSSHKALTTLEPDSEEWDFEVYGGDYLENMLNDGIEVSSFAYPNGLYEEWMNEELSQRYHVVRGYDKYFHVFKVEALKRGGYIPSKSIDYNKYGNDAAFEKDIRKMFAVVKFLGDENVIPLTSHTISLTDTTWAIRPYQLTYIFQQAEKFRLKYYTFSDFR